MQYAIIENNIIVNVAEAEADYAAAQGWVPALDARIGDLWDGEAFVPAPPAPPATPVVPPSVTMRQARLALLGAGLLASVGAAIDGLPSPQKEAARIEWEYVAEVQRSSGLVLMMGAALGLDNVALDALFIEAAAL